ncbi:hypothetical protein [Hoyosella altamirensis]|uniref:Uncharacterized protein n=1 Tax=Hoyosella altamirensis TaxID=616997 RepID=A0A839RUT2_9ACTN|nr:hypothetical protein [Hoyosella altamirensis]MBB3039424.1 hypothetical protein [Hoyosella altamirensis]MBB3039996.1 hypothetical protein [Hoyosella altamirensis]
MNHNWLPPERDRDPDEEFDKTEVILGIILMSILGGLLGLTVFLAWTW